MHPIRHAPAGMRSVVTNVMLYSSRHAFLQVLSTSPLQESRLTRFPTPTVANQASEVKPFACTLAQPSSDDIPLPSLLLHDEAWAVSKRPCIPAERNGGPVADGGVATVAVPTEKLLDACTEVSGCPMREEDYIPPHIEGEHALNGDPTGGENDAGGHIRTATAGSTSDLSHAIKMLTSFACTVRERQRQGATADCPEVADGTADNQVLPTIRQDCRCAIWPVLK